MLHENQVFKWNGTEHRLLKVRSGEAVLYPMGGKSIRDLETIPFEQLESADAKGEIIKLEDPYQALRSRTFEGKARTRAEANYALIENLVAEPGLLGNAHERSALVNAAANGDEVVKRKIYRLLNIYWLKGQVPGAMIPEYGNRTKKPEYTRKPGRRFSDGSTGALVNEEIRGMFAVACRQYLLAGRKNSIADAYRMFLVGYRDACPEAPAPTLAQFSYYYRTNFTQAQKSKGRSTSIAWNKDKRPLLGTAKETTLGIGDVYEIDSTQVDQSLVSEFDRSLVVGRPTLWSVTDRASGMIVGIHVSMDPPSLQGAFDALYNAVMPKKAYCAEFGVDIEEEEWPAKGLPQNIVFDNAELLSKKADILTSAFGIALHNAASYRADSKGTVESSLGGLQKLARPVLPMCINEIKLKKAGGGDNRLEAKLTLKEYTAIIINMVLIRNEHRLETTPQAYPLHLSANPIQCWRWAQANEDVCCLRPLSCTPQELRIAMLVKSKASFSADGICCDGFYYTAQKGIELGWFDRGKGVERPKDMLIAINPDNVGQAWLFEDAVASPFEAIPCRLAAKSLAYDGKPLFEARILRKAKAAAQKQASRDEDAQVSKRMKAAQEIVRKAQKAGIKSSRSRAERTREIAENQTAERILQSQAHPRIPEAEPPQPEEKTTSGAELEMDPLAAFLSMDN